MNTKVTTGYIWLILLAVLVNSYGLFSPVLNSNDAYFYALLSKNILTNHDWVNLTYNGSDWLDKPHFPFWATAFAYQMFGVNPFAYAIAGFLFHVLGAIYTYRLAKMFFNVNVAILATLIYVSCLRLLLSAIDIRAEAFLLGEIIPACFYLWRYSIASRWKHLLLAAFFTGLALMTKGLFVLVTICAGQIFYWLYTRQLSLRMLGKFIGYLVLAFIFALPEFICLYLQFDLHPDKVIFGTTHVSGLMWYFWGSQFGRFFNTGPIVNKHGDPFFFVHTFLWAFLPWTILFLLSIVQYLRLKSELLSSERAKIVYLYSGFAVTFILFSATKFQLDYYTNIIFPFAAILAAFTFYDLRPPKWYFITQNVINLLILLINIVVIVLVFKLSWGLLLLFMPVGILFSYYKQRHTAISRRAITYATLAICSIFITLMYINMQVYPKYNTGYNLNNYLRDKTPQQIYLLNTDKTINTFGFYSANMTTIVIDSPDKINSRNAYVLVDAASKEQMEHMLGSRLLMTYPDIPLEKFVPTLISQRAYDKTIRYYYLYQVN